MDRVTGNRGTAASYGFDQNDPCKRLSHKRSRRPFPVRQESLLTNGTLPGKLWNGANSLIGLLWGAVGLPFGAKLSLGNNAVQFENHPFMFGAITLGNTISYSCRTPPDERLGYSGFTYGDHERQHTYQGEVLGPLYLPSNIIGGALAWAFQGSWHGSLNWNERGPQAEPPRPWGSSAFAGPTTSASSKG